jgi:hypothetical protein
MSRPARVVIQVAWPSLAIDSGCIDRTDVVHVRKSSPMTQGESTDAGT